jgi:hypothetical protein
VGENLAALAFADAVRRVEAREAVVFVGEEGDRGFSTTTETIGERGRRTAASGQGYAVPRGEAAPIREGSYADVSL